MAFERTWPAVAPVQLTANGTAYGLITVTSTLGFKVKQLAILQSSSLPPTLVQVKRILSDTQMLVGRLDRPIDDRIDVSGFTTVDSAFVYAGEQAKTEVPEVDQYHAVYEQEPTVAWRQVLVDRQGKFYETANPLPVRITDGEINIETLNANILVQLSHQDNVPFPGDVHDSVQVGDGHEIIEVNPDGSINVNVVQSTNIDLDGLSYQYGEVLAVPSGVETTILTVLGGATFKRVQKIEVSGQNVAEFCIKLDGTTFAKLRIWHCNFNAVFAFEQFINGFKLLAGQTLTVTALHGRPDSGDFNATAWFI